MYTCLIVSGSSKWAEKLKDFLRLHIEAEFFHAGHCGAARRLASQRRFDFCFINAPLPDEFGFSFAADVMKDGYVQALLIVPGELCGDYHRKANSLGMLVIGKPLQGQILESTLYGMVASQSRALSIQSRIEKLQKQLDDLRLIDRAKCLLIASLGMSESQAHMHIEQEAMNGRISKIAVAKSIIQVYSA